ncbi:MAG TPA: hypothetical protein ENG51_19515 [Deltaproteobacteria bacterium]|nr:hypothetical protein [Deltaproteobacteria bacterium]
MRRRVFCAVIIMLLVVPGVCFSAIISTFEDGSLDGWTKSGDGSITNPGSGGNPGGFLKATDPATGPNTWAIAPSKFLGDWRRYNNTGCVSFDMIILSGGLPTTEKPNVYIAGPGGSAACFSATKASTAWKTFVFPINKNYWLLKSGSWDNLLSNVTEFKIDLEQIQGREVTGIDNVALSQVPIPGSFWLFSAATISLLTLSKKYSSS